MRCTVLLAAGLLACSGPVASPDAAVSDSAPRDAGIEGVDAEVEADASVLDAWVPLDAPMLDAGSDSGGSVDASVDGGRDAGVDAGSTSDAGVDAGPDGGPCDCEDGPCCDGCRLRPTSHVCDPSVVYSATCGPPSTLCPGGARRITENFGNRFCNGSSAGCDGELVHLSVASRECGIGDESLWCTGPAGSASCSFVCD
jgi:hypothetical protein